MRPVSEWDISDLEALVAEEATEGLHIDFKRSDALVRNERFKTELSKDVSAFANAAGGVVVFGIEEENSIASRVDDGVPEGTIGVEWLQQSLNSTVDPRLAGLVVKKIELRNGNITFAIEIPQATTFAPHQAKDGRYYRRYQTQCLPMSDYEIRDLLRRSSTPSPHLNWHFGPITQRDVEFSADVSVGIGNDSPEPMKYATIQIYIDRRLQPTIPAGMQVVEGGVSFQTVDGLIDAAHFRTNHAPPGAMPIFKEANFNLTKLKVTPQRDVSPFVIGWEIACPGALVRRTLLVKYQDGVLTLEQEEQ